MNGGGCSVQLIVAVNSGKIFTNTAATSHDHVLLYSSGYIGSCEIVDACPIFDSDMS